MDGLGGWWVGGWMGWGVGGWVGRLGGGGVGREVSLFYHFLYLWVDKSSHSYAYASVCDVPHCNVQVLMFHTVAS